jgi:hypothetical protein
VRILYRADTGFRFELGVGGVILLHLGPLRRGRTYSSGVQDFRDPNSDSTFGNRICVLKLREDGSEIPNPAFHTRTRSLVTAMQNATLAPSHDTMTSAAGERHRDAPTSKLFSATPFTQQSCCFHLNMSDAANWREMKDAHGRTCTPKVPYFQRSFLPNLFAILVIGLTHFFLISYYLNSVTQHTQVDLHIPAACFINFH